VGATLGPRKVKKKTRSNYECRTPTLQSLTKQQQVTTDEPTKKKNPPNQEKMYVASTMMKLHSKPRRSMKHTMPIQLAVDNNIVQIHWNVIWKIWRKNVLQEAYLGKHLRLSGCLMASWYANI
jgi:hypothetical protein